MTATSRWKNDHVEDTPATKPLLCQPPQRLQQRIAQKKSFLKSISFTTGKVATTTGNKSYSSQPRPLYLAINTNVIREYVGHGKVGSNPHLLPAKAYSII
jgi:hypothetical protein